MGEEGIERDTHTHIHHIHTTHTHTHTHDGTRVAIYRRDVDAEKARGILVEVAAARLSRGSRRCRVRRNLSSRMHIRQGMADDRRRKRDRARTVS